MRFVRFGLLLFLSLSSISGWAQSATSSQPSSAQSASDPQAVAVVQAAITALGGATAIGQAQSWTFQAEMQGPLATGNITYNLGRDNPQNNSVTPPSGTKKGPPVFRSLFVPATLGSVLLSSIGNPYYYIGYLGSVNVGSVEMSVVTFSPQVPPRLPEQIWYFNSATGLLARVEFLLPVVMGSKISFTGTFDVSSYQSIAGVFYPFSIVARIERNRPQSIIIQSINQSTNPSSSDSNVTGGDRLQ